MIWPIPGICMEDKIDRKLRGGYYTPMDLACFLVKWVSGINPKTILEPSCGDGVFLEALKTLDFRGTVTALELDAMEAGKARTRVSISDLFDITVKQGDFLNWAGAALKGNKRFDAIIGNPPFIRYQSLPDDFQHQTEVIFRDLGCAFTRHVNAWVPFLLAGFELLDSGGRMAMVVPTEILHITYAKSLRTHLARKARRIVIIDPEEIWFEETSQGAVLLLVEKKTHPQQVPEGVGIYRVRGRAFTRGNPEQIFAAPRTLTGKMLEEKWTPALLSPATRDLVACPERMKGFRRFHEIASVDVGIVTGANGFFLVDDDTVRRYELEPWAHPMLGRSAQCPGIVYDKAQHRGNADLGQPVNFLWLRNENIGKNPLLRHYIESGESQNLQHRYKCRIRAPWYTVPSVYATGIGLFKRGHDAPRLFLNQMRAYTTDTAYRIRIYSDEIQAKARFVYGFCQWLDRLECRNRGAVLRRRSSGIDSIRG